MLYQPITTEPTNSKPIAARLLSAMAGVFSGLLQQISDRQYLEGMRLSELEDLGLRRTESRDYLPLDRKA
jgi:uncharacterized protein YjiS (DUF1127 family)